MLVLDLLQYLHLFVRRSLLRDIQFAMSNSKFDPSATAAAYLIK